MSEKNTIARPYAQAVFRLAQDHNALGRWSEMLQVMVAMVTDPAVDGLIDNPRVSKEQLTGLLLDVAGDRLDEPARNFIKLLVENHRLVLLPEIFELYEESRKEAERVVQTEVITAFPLSDEQQQQITTALERRLERSVSLRQTVDEALLGGVIIRTEDRVIDGSVTAQLEKLARALAG